MCQGTPWKFVVEAFRPDWTRVHLRVTFADINRLIPVVHRKYALRITKCVRALVRAEDAALVHESAQIGRRRHVGSCGQNAFRKLIKSKT